MRHPFDIQSSDLDSSDLDANPSFDRQVVPLEPLSDAESAQVVGGFGLTLALDETGASGSATPALPPIFLSVVGIDPSGITPATTPNPRPGTTQLLGETGGAGNSPAPTMTTQALGEEGGSSIPPANQLVGMMGMGLL